MNMSLRRRALIGAQMSQKEYYIPPEYQEIEHIAFTGEQWFDTGIYLNNNTRIELDITPTTTPSSTVIYYGAYDGTYNCVLSKGGTAYNIAYQYGAMGGGSYTLTFRISGNNFYSPKVFDLNGDTYAEMNGERETNLSQHTYTCGRTAYFGNVNRASGSYPAYFICRKSKWYEDGTTLSRWYIPVRRLDDDLGGAYDVVNQTFNPSMTTTPFVCGPDI